jgi:3-phenylpropionate/cinnamic acid dioxygenase small subunit
MSSQEAHANWQGRIDDFNARYAACLDEDRLDDWLTFFTNDASYKVISRESADRGLPMGVMSCDGRGMFEDRVVATRQVLVFATRYIRHIVGRARIGEAPGNVLRAETSYLVVQTLVEKPSEIFQSGRYSDEFAIDNGSLLLRRRHCIYDSTLIPNSLIYPI